MSATWEKFLLPRGVLVCRLGHRVRFDYRTVKALTNHIARDHPSLSEAERASERARAKSIALANGAPPPLPLGWSQYGRRALTDADDLVEKPAFPRTEVVGDSHDLVVVTRLRYILPCPVKSCGAELANSRHALRGHLIDFHHLSETEAFWAATFVDRRPADPNYRRRYAGRPRGAPA